MKNLPKIINETYSDIKAAIKKDGVMTVLNQDPPNEWVKLHPYIKGYHYLPIERIEFLLKALFKTDYKIEVLKTGLLLNSVEVTVRIHFKDIASGEWMYHDGVGAQEIQTKKDTGHLQLDMSNINRGAISMALPIAKTVAIKDACDHFGKLFGSDLNRKDYIEYDVDLTLRMMDEDHPNWEVMTQAIKSGKFTVEQVEKKYKITEETKQQLNKMYNERV